MFLKLYDLSFDWKTLHAELQLQNPSERTCRVRNSFTAAAAVALYLFTGRCRPQSHRGQNSFSCLRWSWLMTPGALKGQSSACLWGGSTSSMTKSSAPKLFNVTLDVWSCWPQQQLIQRHDCLSGSPLNYPFVSKLTLPAATKPTRSFTTACTDTRSIRVDFSGFHISQKYVPRFKGIQEKNVRGKKKVFTAPEFINGGICLTEFWFKNGLVRERLVSIFVWKNQHNSSPTDLSKSSA